MFLTKTADDDVGDDDVDGDDDGDDDGRQTATIDENNLATTMARKKRKKRCSNHAKPSENDPKWIEHIRKRLEIDRKTAEHCPKTAEKEKEIK